MPVTINGDFYNVHQRVVVNKKGVVHWRIGLTTDMPLVIEHAAIFGLGSQLGLSQAEVTAALGTETFPPQLLGPNEAPRPVSEAQWAYEPVVKALLALTKVNRSAG